MHYKSLFVIASGLAAFASATTIESPLDTVANIVAEPVNTLVKDVVSAVDYTTQLPTDSNQCTEKQLKDIGMIRSEIDLYNKRVKDALIRKYGSNLPASLRVKQPPIAGYKSPYDNKPCQELQALGQYYVQMRSGKTVFVDGKPFKLPSGQIRRHSRM